MSVSGNTILITGGGSGIGLGLAEAFHVAGNRVIIAGRREMPLRKAALFNPGMMYYVLDVADPASIRAVAARAAAENPALNVLINNAGIMRAEDLLAEPFDLDAAEAMVTTNLLGPIRLTAALLPHLRKQADAAVVNVSSGLAFVPLADSPTYCATKAAIHSYSQSLRFQLRDTPVRVIELAPPMVATELTPRIQANPNAMPLEAFIRETMALLEADPSAAEVCVDRVKPLRNAEASGRYAAMFEERNQPR